MIKGIGSADTAGFQKLLDEAMDPEKVVLSCGIHNYVYGIHTVPNFKCKQCMMVQFMGLMANTAPEKRQETLEMLEESIHHLYEAAERGEIDELKLRKHPKIFFNDKELK